MPLGSRHRGPADGSGVREMEPYRNSLEHLEDELGRLDLLLRRAVLIARATPDPRVPHELRGVVVSDEEVDAVVAAPDVLGERWRIEGEAADALAPIDRALHESRKAIDERRRQTARAGRRLRLPHLAAVFGLSAAEIDLLLIALGPELEPRYETLYSYLQVDATRKRPGVDLALNLICRNIAERRAAAALPTRHAAGRSARPPADVTAPFPQGRGIGRPLSARTGRRQVGHSTPGTAAAGDAGTE